MSGVGPLNGTAGALVASLVGAAAVGGVLLSGVYRELDDLRMQDRERWEQAQREISELSTGRRENEVRIVWLLGKVIEIETQFGAANTVEDLERQMDSITTDLLQQCPTCKLPTRNYYPPRPGSPNAASGPSTESK